MILLKKGRQEQQKLADHVVKEQGYKALRRIVCKSHQHPADSITEFQTFSGINLNTKTVHWEFNRMGYHGQADAGKPYITKCSARHRMEWCKTHFHQAQISGKVFCEVTVMLLCLAL